MHKYNIKQQIFRLYLLTAIGYFQIGGASWVALLAARGFSLLEIGILESIFHTVSLLFEVPSGVAADVWGRKKTLVMSQLASLFSSVLMIFSNSFWTVALAIGCNALNYNLASGSREALAYDSLKMVGREEEYDYFASTEMMIYRITNSLSTLCAGTALFLGFQKAYAIDCVLKTAAAVIACTLKEAEISPCSKELQDKSQETISLKYKTSKKISERFYAIIKESWEFLASNKKIRGMMICNAVIGAVITLVLFFLQAKLPLAGIPHAALGPALFFMGMGAALGAKAVSFFPKMSYRQSLCIGIMGASSAFFLTFTQIPFLMVAGGFMGAFSDDFLQIKTDIQINKKIPSEQRATLLSVNSLLFSLVMIFLSFLMGWIM